MSHVKRSRPPLRASGRARDNDAMERESARDGSGRSIRARRVIADHSRAGHKLRSPMQCVRWPGPRQAADGPQTAFWVGRATTTATTTTTRAVCGTHTPLGADQETEERGRASNKTALFVSVLSLALLRLALARML
jgi:hypothetical protein